MSSEASLITYNEWDESDFHELKSKKHWDFPHAVLEYLPVPKGSKAKPVIEVRGEDGTVISRITGRNGYYSKVKAAVDSSDHFHVIAEYKSGSDYEGYAISIWHSKD